MPTSQEDRSFRLIQAYFELPKNQYVDIVTQIKAEGGLSALEAKLIEEQVAPVHSRTILRHTGTYGLFEVQKQSSH